jgi:hypothetical protein
MPSNATSRALTPSQQITTSWSLFLFSHLRLLEVLFGECCHYKGVYDLRLAMVRKAHKWETFSLHSIVSILWEIFIDARQSFSTTFGQNGEPPSSLRTGTIKAQDTASYTRLMGQHALLLYLDSVAP